MGSLNISCICPGASPKQEETEIQSDTTLNKAELKQTKTTDSEIIINNEILVTKSEGTPLVKYSIKKSLGEGSFGKVYLVTHKETKVDRAMKEIIKNGLEDDNSIRNEIEILKKIDHPNVVKIIEFFTKGNRYYLITEYCEGGELFDLINSTKFTENQVASIMHQLLLSIYYCHINRIVHRDLKPENILIEGIDKNGNYRIKVIDFGTAKIFMSNKNEKKMIGSAYYIAPEVITKNYNEKCDLWSAGIIMYILISGQPPFVGATNSDIFRNILNQPLKFSKHFDNFSSKARDLVSMLLEKDPNDRISASEAMNHHFFKNLICQKTIENDKLGLFINNLKKFKVDYKLQQAAIAIIVHNIPHSEGIRELEQAFRIIDTNGDGRLTKEELREGFIKNLNKTESEANIEIERIFKVIDADKNGYIEYEEFIRASINKEELLNDQYLSFAFKFFDKDGSGFITCEEIKEVFCGGNSNVMNKELIDDIIKEIDIDGDGKISFNEFKCMMNKII